MAEDTSEEANFTRMVVGSVAITMVLLLILPMIFVAGKATYYSAYTEGEGGEVSSLAQVTDMRETMVTDEPVTIYGRNFLVRGNGMIADLNAETLELNEHVQTTYTRTQQP